MFVFNYSLSQELAIGIPCAGADPSSDLKKNRILIRAVFCIRMRISNSVSGFICNQISGSLSGTVVVGSRSVVEFIF